MSVFPFTTTSSAAVSSFTATGFSSPTVSKDFFRKKVRIFITLWLLVGRSLMFLSCCPALLITIGKVSSISEKPPYGGWFAYEKDFEEAVTTNSNIHVLYFENLKRVKN